VGRSGTCCGCVASDVLFRRFLADERKQLADDLLRELDRLIAALDRRFCALWSRSG